MIPPPANLPICLFVVFACLGLSAVGAEPPAVPNVPQPAFMVLQKLASHGGLNVSDPEFTRLPESARPSARQRYDGYQRELIGALNTPDWTSASKRAFIQAVAVEGVFVVEVHPLPRPGFKPSAVKLSGRLTPPYRERLLALLPPPFPENGRPADWLGHGREGWKAMLAYARATPAQYDEAVAALTAHLRPLAADSRLNNQFKPLQEELGRLADLAKAYDQDAPETKLRASVLTRALVFAAAQAAAKGVQPEVPAFVYTRYAVQPVDQKYLPFAETAAPAGGVSQ